MIKVDYEGAWKELKETIERHISPVDMIKTLLPYINELEQKHTHNYIDIRRRSDKEIADYCLKKYTELSMENIYLKKELKEYKEEPLFDVSLECRLNDGSIITICDLMNSKELSHYDTAFREGRKIKYKGKEMRITELTISYKGG